MHQMGKPFSCDAHQHRTFEASLNVRVVARRLSGNPKGSALIIFFGF